MLIWCPIGEIARPFRYQPGADREIVGRRQALQLNRKFSVDNDVQFFVQLAAQGHDGLLARLDMAPREVPNIRIPFTVGVPMTEQDAAIANDDSSRYKVVFNCVKVVDLPILPRTVLPVERDQQRPPDEQRDVQGASIGIS
jgi:hypothetical protein